MVSSQFSPWITQDIIKGDTIFETRLEFFIGLNTTHLKPFHLILKYSIILYMKANMVSICLYV